MWLVVELLPCLKKPKQDQWLGWEKDATICAEEWSVEGQLAKIKQKPDNILVAGLKVGLQLPAELGKTKSL